MKIFFLLSISLCVSFLTFSQNVAINEDGSDPNSSAMLDIKSTNKGFLMPRLTQAQKQALVMPAAGLLVYQTDATSGFYYNAGTPASPNWIRLSSQGTGWEINGNAGTNPSTDFIGTSDAQPLYFKINNQQAGRIDLTHNTAFGLGSLPKSTNLSDGTNTAFGTNSLHSNRYGYFNTAVGDGASYSNIDGHDNLALGLSALYYNTDGIANIAIGNHSMENSLGGLFNVGIGQEALANHSTGESNIGIGRYSLLNVAAGSQNVAVGVSSLQNNRSTGNSALGDNTLKTNETGINNTAIGRGADVGAPDLNNSTAIGAGSVVNTSNTVQIGNSAVTDIYFGSPASTILHASSVTPSDARFKYEIKANVPGLDFIKKLLPVTYYFDEQRLTEYTKTGIIDNSNIKPASYNSNNQLHTGFLAQDVEKIAKELDYSFDGVHVPGNDKDYYSLSYSQFVVPLVKSVQEQQVQIEQLKKENQEVKEELEVLEKMLQKLSTNK